MNKLLASWESACASSGVLRFVDINLRGIGQVMFQDNPLSGALFLAAVVWGSVAAGVPQVALAGVVAVVLSTLTAQWLRVDPAALRAGLFRSRKGAPARNEVFIEWAQVPGIVENKNFKLPFFSKGKVLRCVKTREDRGRESGTFPAIHRPEAPSFGTF